MTPPRYPEVIPFDTLQAGGFGHRGEDCKFETLCKEFNVRDHKVRAVAQIIHDADLEDEKFGRVEGIGLDRVLVGWAQQSVTDDELLGRGIDLIDSSKGYTIPSREEVSLVFGRFSVSLCAEQRVKSLAIVGCRIIRNPDFRRIAQHPNAPRATEVSQFRKVHRP